MTKNRYLLVVFKEFICFFGHWDLPFCFEFRYSDFGLSGTKRHYSGSVSLDKKLKGHNHSRVFSQRKLDELVGGNR